VTADRPALVVVEEAEAKKASWNWMDSCERSWPVDSVMESTSSRDDSSMKLCSKDDVDDMLAPPPPKPDRRMSPWDGD
jgi:hypothetical protein